MATYEPLATTTFGSNTANYTFSSIPNTYKDLVLVGRCEMTGAGSTVYCQLNGDTSSNYYQMSMERQWTVSAIQYTRGGPVNGFGLYGWSNGYPGNNYSFMFETHFNNYAGGTKKTMLTESAAGSAPTSYVAQGIYSSMWNSTAAISSIKIYSNGADLFQTGTMFTLWGLK